MVKLEFEFERETKNTIRFAEVSDEPVIGTLYIQKDAIDGIGWNEGESLFVEISSVQDYV
mgnify:CR=1 FL=1